MPDPNRLMRYDAAGNLVQDRNNALTANGDGGRNFDAENRMTSAQGLNGAWQHYAYDGDGRRIGRTVNGVTTWQVYGFGGELLAEYAAGAMPFLAQKEYGYQGGKLLITATNGNEQRLTRFLRNIYYRAQIPFDEEQLAKQLADILGDGTPETWEANAQVWAQGIFSQSPVTNITEYVRALYLGYLQRYPDAPGLNWWAGLITSGAASREQVSQAFAESAEFELRAQEATGNDASETSRADAFINYTYNAALQRDPAATPTDELQAARDALDLANAKGQAETVTAARALAVGLLSQNNYRETQRNNGEYVQDLYAVFLRYPADEAGLQYWKQQMETQGRAAILNAFAAAPAFEEEARALYREVLWLIGDHLGTPRLIAERTGKAEGIKRRDFLPFGEELTIGGRSDLPSYAPASPRQSFTGYEKDVETGLDYAQARYYGSGMGRFISIDPGSAGSNRGEPQSWNGYAYAVNNPLLFIDPSGMAPTDFIDQGGNRTHLEDGKDQVIYAHDDVIKKLSDLLTTNKPEYDRNLGLLEKSSANNLWMTVAHFDDIASVLYAESSTNATLEETAGIFGVLRNRANADGNSIVEQANDKTQVFGANEKGKIADKNASEAIKRNVYLGIAISVTTGWDASNGAYYWQGVDFSRHFDKMHAHEAFYLTGFHFTSSKHDIWNLGDHKHEWKPQDPSRNKYDYKFESTAAYGKTTFIRLTQEWLTATGANTWRGTRR